MAFCIAEVSQKNEIWRRSFENNSFHWAWLPTNKQSNTKFKMSMNMFIISHKFQQFHSLHHMNNNQRHSPFIMLPNDSFGKRVGHQIQACCCFRFHYITFMEGRRSEKQKTLVQPAVRFSLSVAPLWRPPPLTSSIQTTPHTNTHTHTHSPQHTRGLCCLSVVGWLRNLLTHTFSQGLSVNQKVWGRGWLDMCTCVCICGMISNITEVGLEKI